MAFAILRVVLRRLQRDGKISMNHPLPEIYQSWSTEEGRIVPISKTIPEPERPPLKS
jgi:hypothetical protein